MPVGCLVSAQAVSQCSGFCRRISSSIPSVPLQTAGASSRRGRIDFWWLPAKPAGSFSTGAGSRKVALRARPSPERTDKVTAQAESSTETPLPLDRWEETGEAAVALVVFLSILGLGQLSTIWRIPLLDLPYFVVLASVTIYIAAHRSTTRTQRQQISFKQGALAPLAASAALVSGYLVVKYFPQLSLQLFFNAYFWLLGSLAVAGTFQAPMKKLAEKLGQDWKLDVPRGLLKDESGKDLAEDGLLGSDLVALIIGVGAATADVLLGHHNFTLNNLLACLIAVDILGLISLSSFRTAAVLMLGLLAYDVFWVFGSPKVVGDNVMLTVATSDVLTGPVRLLFPRPPGTGEAKAFPFALLGLGDVAVPGLLACLALRYDTVRQQLTGAGPANDAQALASLTGKTSPKQTEEQPGDVYFWACMGAYLAGLLCAFAASTISKLGQPALLYIVPAMLAAVGGTALVQGEVQEVLAFKEAPIDSPFSAVEEKDKQ